MSWQPVETAPKDGSDIILLIEDVAIQAYWDKSKYARPGWQPITLSSHGCGCCSSSNEDPTHWMPLPEAPK